MRRFRHLFSEGSDKYAQYRQTYPSELYQLILNHCSPTKELAVDVATGTGQAAAVLSKSFTRVVATDVSPQQISNAPVISNVKYEVAAAENFVEDLHLKNGSVDLVTVAQGLHWFDIHAFYNQCRRALKPDGVLAAWGYGLFTFVDNTTASSLLRELSDEVLGRYWAPPVQLVRDKYRTVLPADQFQQSEWFSLNTKMQRTMKSCMGYLTTWSAYKAYRTEHPDEADPLDIFYDKAMKEMQLEDPDKVFEVDVEMFGFIAKKPSLK